MTRFRDPHHLLIVYTPLIAISIRSVLEGLLWMRQYASSLLKFLHFRVESVNNSVAHFWVFLFNISTTFGLQMSNVLNFFTWNWWNLNTTNADEYEGENCLKKYSKVSLNNLDSLLTKIWYRANMAFSYKVTMFAKNVFILLKLKITHNLCNI